MSKKYYVGLDIGTDSIGWAVTDEDYNLLKARGKALWGTYLFDPAQTANDRRMSRTGRRRIARRGERIDLLQELFAPEIAKNDMGFFRRLDESSYYAEDKTVFGKGSLFNGGIISDKSYFKKYPTIYHLRKAFLCPETAKEIKDVRLLYLAVHHIIKNRGHFLFEGQSIDAISLGTAKNSLFDINAILSDNYGLAGLNMENASEALEVLADAKKSRMDKQKILCNLFKVAKDKKLSTAVKGIVGLKIKLSDLFGDDYSGELALCFEDSGFELEKYSQELDDTQYELISRLKAVYDWSKLSQILNGYEFISQSMAEKYDSHKRDLKRLKDYIKNNCPSKYEECFHFKEKVNNYAAYVGRDLSKKFKHAKKEDFYKYLKSFVKDEEILERIEKGSFLEKQRTNANGVIPYQCHLAELKQILANATQNFAFLKEESDGYTVKEKIELLLTFKVPYFVGPLNTAHATKTKGAWIKKYAGKEFEKITPWNFKDIVDLDKSEDEFIRRMTNKCTYLLGEDVLPKQSLLYSEFMFLNELNNLTFRGNRLDKSARESIIAYAKEVKKVTIKGIGKRLEAVGLIEKGEGKPENFAGTDGDFKSSLSILTFFKNIFGDDFDREMCEQIVLWATLMESKDRLAKRIKSTYKLSDDVIKQLKSLNCSGWGRLSKKLLTDIYGADENGEAFNIITAMQVTGKNFMELLSQNYTFSDAINQANAELQTDRKVTYAELENLYCSPSVKRAIWRTLVLVKEIVKINGGEPERIFIEMARGADESQKGKRTKSRKQQLIDLYANIVDEERDWIKEIDIPENDFLRDRLFLYYTQMGKSAYSGKPISLSDVFNTNVCDVDHIYPQSKIKDDSLINNKVLCYKTENATKSDVYPLDSKTRNSMLGYWSYLLDKNLITKEKFNRLTRSTPLTQDELTDFINRQLVETRQSTKAVARILSDAFENADVVYSKARNVSDFKDDNDIVKVRELNDLHHAKDAYFNIVVGNVYYTKFNRNASIYFKSHDIDSYNMKNLFKYDIPKAWKVSDRERIVKVADRNDCRVVRFTSEGSGALFNATIETKEKGDKLIPLKQKAPYTDTSKYGGYNSATTAYFTFVRSKDKKGKTILSLEAIPIYIDILGEEKVTEYIQNDLELICPERLIKKIKLNSLLKINDSYVYLRGKTGQQVVLCNANQLVLDAEKTAYIKKVVKIIEKQKKLKKDIAISEKYDKITAEDNLRLYRTLYAKLVEKPYKDISISSQAEFLKNKEEVFVSLGLNEQCNVLYEVLHLMQCNRVNSDFRLLGGDSTVGTIRHSKNLKQDEKFLLITQSPTGYYHSAVELTAYFNQ